MIKITETVRNLMKFDSKPSSNSKFVEEKLGVIDYDFAVGITAEITEINDDVIKMKLTLGNSLLRNLILIKGEESSFSPDTRDVSIKYTFFYK